MKLYSKENITSIISSMINQKRLCHSFILSGEDGIGKRTVAKYMAMQMLCRNTSGKPCLECRNCKMVLKDAHPDVIYVQPSGKQGNYRADDLRPIVSDASIASNEGGYKIYILLGIDKALPVAQNTLLKVFEEPPEHVIFIMTASKKEKVLGTILSRAVVLNVSECSREDTISALKDNGAGDEQAAECYELFGGNIGKCLEYLKDGGTQVFHIAQNAAIALSSNDEYALAKELYIQDRDFAISVCSELIRLIGDACLIKQCAEPSSGLYKKVSQSLAANVRLNGLMNMYEALNCAIDKLSGNSGVVLTMCNLCAEMKKNAV